jgi:DNA-binding NarL/FixJ family response regulator
MSRIDDIAAQPRSTDMTMVEARMDPSGGPLLDWPASVPADLPCADVIKVGLIDSIQFSQDCLIRAFNATHPDLRITPFDSISACVQTDRTDLDAVLYCTHDDGLSENQMLQGVAELKQKFALTPVVVLSDSQIARQPQSVRNALKSGARGFIPTLNTRVPTVLAALRFIKDGGTFVPLDLVLPSDTAEAPRKIESTPADALTPRQKAVLSHLKQGKANKIIAYELGMSESTVKVHIRNIMRKMGATNRTQAVYKSQQLNASY